MTYLIAHRGFRSGDKENRAVDFQNALQFTRAVEFDVRLTRDKQVLIFHDEDFYRIARDSRRVKSLDFAQIKQINFFLNKPDFTPLLFDDFMEKFGDDYQLINVEIKPDHYTLEEEKIIFNKIQSWKHLKAQIIVSSFDFDLQKKIIKLPSRFKKGFLFNRFSDLNKMSWSDFDYLHVPFKLLNSPRYIKTFKEINRPLIGWTYQNQSQANRSKQIYQQQMYGYISDNPELKL
ncbi:glycerophosphodiester phosphodiesterase family protein [Mycoplasma sp. ATU-Cv-703]|uniref:glycerophosphodiester phosphodiesterase family protein n=1 Tax=Mycoplasma sp. ATU-Cv-703 TaxID=2498595 RepID=UPI001374B1CB